MYERSMMVKVQHLGISMLQKFISSLVLQTPKKYKHNDNYFSFHLLAENYITCGTI